MPGVYVRSVRMPHLHLPTCKHVHDPVGRPTVQVEWEFHQSSTHCGKMMEDAPCTLNIFRGRNATQLVGGNFCLRQQKHAVFTYGRHGEPSHASENRLDPCAPQPMAKHEFRVSFVICPTRVSYRLRFSEKKKALRPCKIPKLSHVAHIHVNICKSCNMMDRFFLEQNINTPNKLWLASFRDSKNDSFSQLNTAAFSTSCSRQVTEECHESQSGTCSITFLSVWSRKLQKKNIGSKWIKHFCDFWDSPTISQPKSYLKCQLTLIFFKPGFKRFVQGARSLS